MADARIDLKNLDLKNLDLKAAARPLYAGVGATDLAVNVARQYLSDVQSRVTEVQKKLEKLDLEPKHLNAKAQSAVTTRVDAVTKTVTKDAKARQAALEAKLAELQTEAKKAQARFEAQLAELQGDAKSLPAKAQAFVADTLAEVAETYAELVKRGEVLVARIRTQETTKEAEKAAATTSAKARATVTQDRKSVV